MAHSNNLSVDNISIRIYPSLLVYLFLYGKCWINHISQLVTLITIDPWKKESCFVFIYLSIYFSLLSPLPTPISIFYVVKAALVIYLSWLHYYHWSMKDLWFFLFIYISIYFSLFFPLPTPIPSFNHPIQKALIWFLNL